MVLLGGAETVSRLLRLAAFDQPEAGAGFCRTAIVAIAAWQLENFERPGTVGQAADKAALLKRCNQPVDPGLRLERKRILHLIERGRHPGLAEAFVDEHQEVFLLLGQHAFNPTGGDRRNEAEHAD